MHAHHGGLVLARSQSVHFCTGDDSYFKDADGDGCDVYAANAAAGKADEVCGLGGYEESCDACCDACSTAVACSPASADMYPPHERWDELASTLGQVRGRHGHCRCVP